MFWSHVSEDGKGVDVRSGRADIGKLPFEVLLQRLKALEGDLELVGSVEWRRVIPHGDVEQAHYYLRSA